MVPSGTLIRGCFLLCDIRLSLKLTKGTAVPVSKEPALSLLFKQHTLCLLELMGARAHKAKPAFRSF